MKLVYINKVLTIIFAFIKITNYFEVRRNTIKSGLRFLVFLSLSSAIPAWSAEYSESEGVNNTIISSLGVHFLPPIQNGDSIIIKSQKPIYSKTQGFLNVSIQGDWKNHKEMVLKKIVPGEDGRKQVLQTHTWPDSVHGMISATFCTGNTYCGSGTLIGTNLVLTAAHNLYERELNSGRPIGRAIEVRFFPAINGKELPFKEQKVQNFYYPKEYEDGKNEDYGLLILENHVGNTTGYFGLNVLSVDEVSKLSKKGLEVNLNVTGYPGDKVKEKPGYYEMWGMSGPIHSVDQGFINYEIDTYFGQSGSGVLYQKKEFEKDGSYLLIGVHVLGDEVLSLNKATLLTKDRYERIRDWVSSEITSIDLNGKQVGAFDIIYLFTCRFSNLCNLNLSNAKIGDDEGCILSKKLNKILTLRTLILSLNFIGEKTAKKLAKNKTISHLDLSHNSINYRGAKDLVKNEHFQDIILSHNKIEKEKAGKILKYFKKKNNTLKKLSFSNPYVVPTTQRVVAIALGGTIAAGACTLGASAIGAIGACTTGGCPCIATLGICACGTKGAGIGIAGVTGAGGVGLTVTCLEKVDHLLGKFKMGSDETVILKNTTLTELDLSDNLIDDTVAEALRKELENNTTLTSLNLTDNSISTNILKSIGDLLNRNKKQNNKKRIAETQEENVSKKLKKETSRYPSFFEEEL